MYEHILQKRPSVYHSVTVRQLGKRSAHEVFTQRYVYVMYKVNENRTRATRVLTTNDNPPTDWEIGSVIGLTTRGYGKFLGLYMVVGIRDEKTNQEVGDVPDIKLAHGTFEVH